MELSTHASWYADEDALHLFLSLQIKITKKNKYLYHTFFLFPVTLI
jgi:hypothetical protein